MPNISRREIFRFGAAGAGVLTISGLLTTIPDAVQAQAAQQQQQRPPALEKELVQAFVRAGHGDLDKTKAMLAEQPGLINATWDWGGGDFETALGGASHMGRPDIAAFLLASGARMDLFCAAMMGKVEIVKACIADDPAIVNVKGPHGISLLRHAQSGKNEAMIALVTAAGAH
jgi:hypothetical protein